MLKTKFLFTFCLIIALTGYLLTPTTAIHTQELFSWTKLTTQAEFVTDGYQSTAVYDSESDKVIYFDHGDGFQDFMTPWVNDDILDSWTNMSSSGFIRQAAASSYQYDI